MRAVVWLVSLALVAETVEGHTPTLVGYWPLNESAGTSTAVDYSGYGHSCAYTAATPGIKDSAGHVAPGFDGYNGILLCDGVTNPSNSFTYTLSFRPACDFRPYGSSQQIMLAGTTVENPTPLIYQVQGRVGVQVVLNVNDNSTYFANSFFVSSSANTFSNKGFHDLVASFDGSVLSIAVDGVVDTAELPPGMRQVPSVGVAIGAFLRAYSPRREPMFGFNGQVKDVRVMHGVNDSAEVDWTLADGPNKVPPTAFSSCGYGFTVRGLIGHEQLIAGIVAGLAFLPCFAGGVALWRSEQPTRGPAVCLVVYSLMASVSYLIVAVDAWVISGPHSFEHDTHHLYPSLYILEVVAVCVQALSIASVLAPSSHNWSCRSLWAPVVGVTIVEVGSVVLMYYWSTLIGFRREGVATVLWAAALGAPFLVSLRTWYRSTGVVDASDRWRVQVIIILVTATWILRRLTWTVTDAKHGLSPAIGLISTGTVDLARAVLLLIGQMFLPYQDDAFLALRPSLRQLTKYLTMIVLWRPSPHDLTLDQLHYPKAVERDPVVLFNDDDVDFAYAFTPFSPLGPSIQATPRRLEGKASASVFEMVQWLIGLILVAACAVMWFLWARTNNVSHIPEAGAFLTFEELASSLKITSPTDDVHVLQCLSGHTDRANTYMPAYVLKELGLVHCLASIDDYSKQAACSVVTGWNDVYGSGHYALKSNICRAAVHAGVIDGNGGCAAFKFIGGEATYHGANQHGVESASVNFTKHGRDTPALGVSFTDFSGTCAFRTSYVLAALSLVALLGVSMFEVRKPVLFLATAGSAYWTLLAVLKHENFALSLEELNIDNFLYYMLGVSLLYLVGPRHCLRDRSDPPVVDDLLSPLDESFWTQILKRVPQTRSGILEHNFFFFVIPWYAGARACNWWADETDLLSNIVVTFDPRSPNGDLIQQFERLPPGGIAIVVTAVVVVTVVVVFHVYLARRSRALLLALGSYGTIIGCLCFVFWALNQNHSGHFHHWGYPLLLIPLASHRNKMSTFTQGFLFGISTQGAAGWGLDTYFGISIPRSF